MLTDETISKNKARFLAEISKVNRNGIGQFTAWLNTSDFFTAPATAFYECDYAGGLCEHSLNIYDCALKFRDDYKELKTAKGETPIDITDDEVRISGLLTGIYKVNMYTTQKKMFKDESNTWMQYTAYTGDDKFPLGYGEKSIFLLQHFFQITGPEALAIRWASGYMLKASLDGGEKAAMLNALKLCPLVNIIQHAVSMSTYLLEKSDDPKENATIAN